MTRVIETRLLKELRVPKGSLKKRLVKPDENFTIVIKCLLIAHLILKSDNPDVSVINDDNNYNVENS